MFGRFSVKMSLIVLLVSVAYAQNFVNVHKSSSSTEVVENKFADVIIDLTITDPQVLDQINNILPSLSLTNVGTHRLVLEHADFIFLIDSIDSLDYVIINPATNLPTVLSRMPAEEISEGARSTLQQWTDACTVQGNNEEWHDGDWTEGVNPTTAISYYTWGCLGCDAWNNTGSAYWTCSSININSSQVRILFKTMGIEGDFGDYVKIYLRRFDTWEWVYWTTITDKSNSLWAIVLNTAYELQTYVSSSGRCDLIAESNDGWVFDVVKFEYECPTPYAPALLSPSNGATCVEYSSTYFDWGNISSVGGYEINISPGGTYWTPNSYYNKNLSQNTTYTWKVRAENPCGWGAWSSTRTFTTKGSPGTPSLSSPSNGATCVAYSPTYFDWSNVSGATEYQIYISPGGTYTTTSSSYNRTLSACTTYSWKVRAKNNCGVWGSWSSTRTFTTTCTPGTPSLVSPSNGSTGVDPDPVNFDWSSVSGAIQYEINISPGGTYTASSSNYSRTLSEGTSYSWRVRAKNSCEVWGDWSVTWNFTTDSTQQSPTVITDAATDITSTSVSLNGTINPNGASTTYYFEYGTSISYGTTTSTQNVGSGTSNVSVNAEISGLTPNTTYHFRLVASNSGGVDEGNDTTFTTSTVAVDAQREIPRSFELKAAYPNPFNPETTIGFALPKATHVSLVVYDIWGREVHRLLEGYLEPGNHQLGWQGIYQDEQKCPSGIYIIRMITPEYIHTIKLLLLK